VTELRFVDYGAVFDAALSHRRQHDLHAAAADDVKVGLLIIDNQYTFCHPKGELFVAGRSGNAAVEDSQRLVEFIYQNLGVISGIHCTLDTHRAYAVFHPTHLVDQQGSPPAPFTLVTTQEVRDGKWSANPLMASALKTSPAQVQAHLLHTCEELESKGRYNLTIWPFHAMLGGPGHALVSGLEEACFFHAISRGAQTGYEVKGTSAWTENYSVLGPEVLTGPDNNPIPGVGRNTRFIEQLLEYDILVIAGQAKSHCVAWTIDDLLEDIAQKDPELAKKVYLVEDCTSPVVVPGLDYTDEADEAFKKFVKAGMHVVDSTAPISEWDGVSLP
jgi:nicotinamidase-related amidase